MGSVVSSIVFYVRVARTMFHSFRARLRSFNSRETLLLPLEHKVDIFSTTCNIVFSVSILKVIM